MLFLQLERYFNVKVDFFSKMIIIFLNLTNVLSVKYISDKW